jgi:hypothetical protein
VRIGGRLGSRRTSPGRRVGWLVYGVKALAPIDAARLGVTPAPTLRALPGRRVTTTRNLKPAARRTAGWRELRTDAELRAALHPTRSAPAAAAPIRLCSTTSPPLLSIAPPLPESPRPAASEGGEAALASLPPSKTTLSGWTPWRCGVALEAVLTG